MSTITIDGAGKLSSVRTLPETTRSTHAAKMLYIPKRELELGAVATTVFVLSTNGMDDFKRTLAQWDLRPEVWPGLIRVTVTQIDSSVMYLSACYDSEESMDRNATNVEEIMAVLSQHCVSTPVRVKGSVFRTYAEPQKVVATTRLQVAVGHMDNVIEHLKHTANNTPEYAEIEGTLVALDSSTLLLQGIYPTAEAMTANHESRRHFTEMKSMLTAPPERIVCPLAAKFAGQQWVATSFLTVAPGRMIDCVELLRNIELTRFPGMHKAYFTKVGDDHLVVTAVYQSEALMKLNADRVRNVMQDLDRFLLKKAERAVGPVVLEFAVAAKV